MHFMVMVHELHARPLHICHVTNVQQASSLRRARLFGQQKLMAANGVVYLRNQ